MQLTCPFSSSTSLPPSGAEWLGKHPSFLFTPSPSIILGDFEVNMASQFLDHLISDNFFLRFISARTLLSHGFHVRLFIKASISEDNLHLSALLHQ